MQEAHIEQTPEGQVPVGGGWFILNLGEMAWASVPGFGVWLDPPNADPSQPGIGVHVHEDRARLIAGSDGDVLGSGRGVEVVPLFGSPDPRRKVEWIANEVAARHGASVAKTTGRDTEAYGDPLPEEVRVRPPKPFARSATAVHEDRGA